MVRRYRTHPDSAPSRKTAPTLKRCVEIVRQVRPDIVITHAPADYMVDHEMTSKLVRSACFGAPAANFLTSAIEPAAAIERIPHLYYADPIEGKDPLGDDVAPALLVDISSVIDTKEQMLACHASQREWLRAHHGMDQYIASMKEWGATRGKQLGVGYAEGFRQHLGHAYPQNNVIGELLGT
ncbi:MAG: PIG-L family deacetylase [Planctomycetes bacterium]|nr:PIG-L family deacetylase [Planctomycetota bacterium]